MGIHDMLDRYQFINAKFHSRSKSITNERAIDVGTSVHSEIHYIAKNNGKFPPTMHIQTVYFVHKLGSLGWDMINAEVPLDDSELGYSTKIDVLARDRTTKKQIVLEVKTTSATWSEAQFELDNIAREPKYLLPESSPWSSLKEFKVDNPISRALAQVTLEYHSMRANGTKDIAPFVIFLFNDVEFPKSNVLKQPEDMNYPVRLYYPGEDALSDVFYRKLLGR